MTEPTPMTIRLTAEEHEFLAALGGWWFTQGKIDEPSKVATIRRLLRAVTPPANDPSPLAKQLRAAHAKLFET